MPRYYSAQGVYAKIDQLASRSFSCNDYLVTNITLKMEISLTSVIDLGLEFAESPRNHKPTDIYYTLCNSSFFSRITLKLIAGYTYSQWSQTL